jgi:molecular chaperone DnaK
MAGFDVMDIINEPTSAAVAFGFQQGYLRRDSDVGRSQRILVYDLGGGTFDVTVMEVGGIDFVALATDGDVRLGGRDWDQRLVDYVSEEFIRTHRMDPREDANTHGRLWRECEDAKRTLSARSRTHIACDYRGHAVRVAVSRQQFESMTQDLLDRTAFTTEQAIQAARLQWSDIDCVLLVGGSTRMPAVCNMLRTLSGREPDCSISPDEAVAHGAALHAGLLLDRYEGKKPRFSIKNVNSHSLGVAAVDPTTRRKQTAVLIPRNTALPVTAKRIFTTSKDGQRSVLVQIVEGETESPDDCVQIGRCTVRDLPPNLPAQTPVEVRFRYEENGRLTVRVRVAGTGRDLRHEIARENALTWDQLNQWRQRISGLPPAEDDASDGSRSTELMQYTTLP